ncbi:aminodeoxychorismate lyase [Guptibacillus algicola]|uniref:aminodeoxychorismate lyase n=1 Tax=Guptibacillus algicola TaxID=225844 RepID=UPI001CD6BF44|nr:aminodeoxychorismate lyase [Alkalihalobacillus algicola]MCA0989542.1 aminodeoxychorismate lyase [Alkalihalobacillus algicola]
MFINVNGEITREEDAVISAYDHGFLYGLGVFETFRTYDGHPFLFNDHIQRLRASLEELHIHLSIGTRDLLHEVKRTLAANDMVDGYIRLNVSAGAGNIGLQTKPYEEPTLIIYVKSLGAPVRNEKDGKVLSLRRNTPEGQYRLKSHHYLNNILAKREIGNDPKVEGIFLTEEGYVAEGIVSNLFWVSQNTLFTPSLSTGILNGITRQYVMKSAEKLQLPVKEGLYNRQTLFNADEVFVTNSIQEIVPLRSVDRVSMPGSNGTVTSKLILQYEQDRTSLLSSNDLT